MCVFDERFVNVIDRINARRLNIFVSVPFDIAKRSHYKTDQGRICSKMNARAENRQIRPALFGNCADQIRRFVTRDRINQIRTLSPFQFV
jgi:hypothetical protein